MSEASKTSGNRPLLIVALLLAGVAAYLMWMYGRYLERQYSPGVPEEVVVATRNLAPGSRLRSTDLETKTVPSNYIRSGVVRVRDLNEVRDRTLVQGLEPGDILLWSDISGGQDLQDSIGQYLEKGQRALTIRVDQTSAAGGNLKPGDRVDVMATLIDPNTRKETTVTLLENVAVVATGTRIGRSAPVSLEQRSRATAFGTVTLMLHSADSAEMLAFAQNHGKLDLVIRSPEAIEEPDQNVGEARSGTTYSTIFGQERKKIQKKHNRTVIEIIRATRKR